VPKWPVTAWLILAWTFAIGGLFVSVLMGNRLRYLDVLFVVWVFSLVWLAGATLLALLWLVTAVRREWLRRKRLDSD
jgi:hypothetical protein